MCTRRGPDDDRVRTNEREASEDKQGIRKEQSPQRTMLVLQRSRLVVWLVGARIGKPWATSPEMPHVALRGRRRWWGWWFGQYRGKHGEGEHLGMVHPGHEHMVETAPPRLALQAI